ncbi:Spy/CpxP family protein refolding chaperone [Hyphomicrobium denitrificans]|uniref:Spy/CpxP family protein refolding chaperone n=1 Tax=Hyphomicrobium denitrificans TaxID=53399 RepID=UPI001FCC6D04|nr:Spy/CpxP family protein refolding chaperone [Hyphomicrobium denitrificans]
MIASVLLAMAVTTTAAMAQSQQGSGMMGNGQGMMGGGMQGMMGGGMMGPNGMMGGGMHGMMGKGMMGPGMMMGNGPVMEGQLAYLKAELGITDAQTQVWNDYVKAAKDRAASMQSMRATMMQAMQSGTAIERLQVRIQAMQSMLDSMKAITPATEALYKALSDDQKKKADLLLGTGCCML